MTRVFGVVLTAALVMVFVSATDASAARKPQNITIKLQEFSIIPLPTDEVKAGTFRMKATNKGTSTHEMVLVRAASETALPTVTTAGGERAVGAVDEEAIPEAAKVGETGDVKPGKTVTKTFRLSPGHYVMFCNIDDSSGNHFAKRMSSPFIVRK